MYEYEYDDEYIQYVHDDQYDGSMFMMMSMMSMSV